MPESAFMYYTPGVYYGPENMVIIKVATNKLLKGRDAST